MKSKRYRLLSIYALSFIMLFAVMPQVFANDEQDVTTSDMITLVEELEMDGQFTNESAVRALTMHLTAVNHFEQQGETDKIVEHMNSFKRLLDHQLDNELITESAFESLLEHTDRLITRWDDVTIVRDGQAEAVVIIPPAVITPEIPGWDQNNESKVYVVDSMSYTGSYSLYMDDDNDSGILSARSDFIEIDPNKSYEASVMTYIESGDPWSLIIEFYDENRRFIDGLGNRYGTVGEWIKLSTRRDDPPENAAYARLRFYTLGSALTSAYVDDAVLKEQGGDGENLLTNSGFEQLGDEFADMADILVEYVQKSTGAELPVVTKEAFQRNEENYEGFARIYLGNEVAPEDPHIDNGLYELKEDGFLIHPHRKNITIVGPTVRGTKFGVYDFLQRYIGVRWLMPDEAGEDVPQMNDLYVPQVTVKEEPAYSSRGLYPLMNVNINNDQIRYQWGQFMRLYNQNPGATHFVYRFFPPSQYEETHPEYYPRDENGVIQVPSPHSGWQPCFSNEDTVQVAVDWIIDYFDNNPDQSAISLAVTDRGNYCEEYPHHPGYTNERNSIGLTNMSDIYYAWVNNVVEQVLEVYPDKSFGVLAYQEVYDPPSFQLHERVVPFLTKDRMSWADPVVRAEDQQHVEWWAEKAESIGFYDYIYGEAYMVPRVYNHLMDDILKYGANNSVVAFFGELTPNWGEGPKPWLISQLLWDPTQDADQLLNEWYVRAVGSEAAPYLKKYYDHWEDFWENRVQETDWFQSRKRIVYFNFNSASYLNIVTDEEIAQSRTWLETAVAKAGTEKQQERAELLLRAFEYYEASALSYPKAVEPLTDDESALALLERAVNYEQMVDYAKKRQELVDGYEGNPILYRKNDINIIWSGLNANAFWELADYIANEASEDGAVRQRAEELAQGDQSKAVYAKLLLQAADGEQVNLNSSFEEQGDPNDDKVTAEHWDANVTNFGTFEWKEEMPFSGDASIYLHDFYYGDINQTVDAKHGLAITRLKYYVTPDTETVGGVWLELNLLDENGEELKTIQSEQQMFSSSLGRWETIQIMDIIPDQVDGVSVEEVRMSATINGFFEGGTMYLDDFELFLAE